MNIFVYRTVEMKEKEVLSRLIEAIFGHIQYSPDEVLKEYIKWCYDKIYKKDDKIHKSRQKELDYILEQEGLKLQAAIIERFQRGFEDVMVGGKRLKEIDVTMMKKRGKPKKRSHS